MQPSRISPAFCPSQMIGTLPCAHYTRTQATTTVDSHLVWVLTCRITHQCRMAFKKASLNNDDDVWLRRRCGRASRRTTTSTSCRWRPSWRSTTSWSSAALLRSSTRRTCAGAKLWSSPSRTASSRCAGFGIYKGHGLRAVLPRSTPTFSSRLRCMDSSCSRLGQFEHR